MQINCVDRSKSLGLIVIDLLHDGIQRGVDAVGTSLGGQLRHDLIESHLSVPVELGESISDLGELATGVSLPVLNDAETLFHTFQMLLHTFQTLVHAFQLALHAINLILNSTQTMFDPVEPLAILVNLFALAIKSMPKVHYLQTQLGKLIITHAFNMRLVRKMIKPSGQHLHEVQRLDLTTTSETDQGNEKHYQ